MRPGKSQTNVRQWFVWKKTGTTCIISSSAFSFHILLVIVVALCVFNVFNVLNFVGGRFFSVFGCSCRTLWFEPNSSESSMFFLHGFWSLALLVWRIQNSPKTWILPMSMFNLWLMFQPCFPGSRRIVIYDISLKISQPEFKDYQGWVSLKPLTLQETNISCFPAGTFLSRWFSISTRFGGSHVSSVPNFRVWSKKRPERYGMSSQLHCLEFSFWVTDRDTHTHTHTDSSCSYVLENLQKNYKWISSIGICWKLFKKIQ